MTVLVSFLLGMLILRLATRLASRLTRAEFFLFSYAVGAACLSLLVFLVCAAGLVYDVTFVLISVGTVAAWWRSGRGPSGGEEFPLESGVRSWNWVLGLIGVPYGLLYLVNAMAPETAADAVGYHLGLVSRYYREHGFEAFTTSVYGYLSQGAEMLYLFAYAFGRHSAAKLVHFSFFIAALGAMLLFGRRYGLWRAAVAGVVLYACSPVVGMDGTVAYNDCALAFYQFLMFYALAVWWGDGEHSWLWVIGVLAGFCFAVKYTGVYAPAAASLLVAAKGPGMKRGLRRAAKVAAVAALFVAPWLIKNAVVTGNPVAPFYNDWFPNPHVTEFWERPYREQMKYYSVTPEGRQWRSQPLQAALELTVRGHQLQGLAGPVFLTAPLALLAWRRRWGKPFLAAAVVAALPWWDNAGMRFLIPALVFVSLALGLLLETSSRMVTRTGAVILFFHAVSCWPAVVALWHPRLIWGIQGFPLRGALRIDPDYAYLTWNLEGYTVAQLLSKHAPVGSRVLSLVNLPEAYFAGEILVSHQGALNLDLAEELMTVVDPDRQPTRHVRLRWPTAEYSGLRIVQMRDHDSTWKLSEVSLLSEDKKILPNSRWRVSTSTYSWTAGRLFDGDPLSTWRSWKPLEAGSWVEVDFQQSLALDGAELVYPWGQHFAEFQYQGRDRTGSWTEIKTKSEVARRWLDPQTLKQRALQELNRHDIRFLVTKLNAGGHNKIAPALEDDAASWGLEEVGRHQAYRVYRVSGWKPPVTAP